MQVSKRALRALAIAAAVVGVAWFLRATHSGREVQEWRVDRRERAGEAALTDSARRLGRLVHTAAVWSQADSALHTTDAAVVVIGARASAPVQAAESLLRLLPGAPERLAPSRFVIIERSAIAGPLTGMPWAFARLPTPGTAEPCVAVRVVFPRDSTISRWELEAFRQSPWEGAIGPCWYLARFGPPGPQIRRWLDARYWDVAAAIPPLGLRPYVQERRSGGWFEGIVLGELDRITTEAALLEGCTLGNPERCQAGLLDSPRVSGLMPTGMVGEVRQSWGFATPSWHGPSLLATMLQELGPERFAHFWQSDSSVQQAFQLTAGSPLGEWYAGQVRRQLQLAGYPVPLGEPAWPAVLAFLALALLGVAWHAGRRQVR